MMTQSHLLVAAAVFTRPRQPWRNAAALAGGFLPDAALYGLFAWGRLSGMSLREIFGVLNLEAAQIAAMPTEEQQNILMLRQKAIDLLENVR